MKSRLWDAGLTALMFDQTFQLTDLPVIGILILLEGLLSADNALVLAIMVRHLKPELQRKALLYGLGGAFVFRFIAIALATYILELWWLQALGAIYLVFITIKHFLVHSQPEDKKKVRKPMGFWQTVALVEVTDIAFAVDSVLAAVGMVRGPDKIWVVYVGALIGVILLRFAATYFIKLLDRFPGLEHLAYTLVGWVGIKLILMAGHNFTVWWNQRNPQDPLGYSIPEMNHTVFWIVMGVIIVVGTVWTIATARKNPLPSPETEAAVEAIEEAEPRGS